MITPHDQKWIDDQEILERKLLERLNPDEQARLENLLKDNPSLASALDLEAMMIAGIRQKGREDLKNRLKAAVENQTAFNMPTGSWRLLKVAAAVLVLAGGSIIAYYALKPADVSTVAKEQSPVKEQPAVKKVVPTEDKATEKVQGKEEKEALAVRKPKEKPKSIVAAPKKPPIFRNRESATMPPPKELQVKMWENQTAKTAVIKFLDPQGLNVKPAFGESSNTLDWFYASYQTGELSIYVEAQRFSGFFTNAELKIDGQTLSIHTAGLIFLMDLTESPTVRKVIRQ